MNDSRPKAGQSFEDMMKAERAELRRIKYEAALKPEVVGDVILHDKCPDCGDKGWSKSAADDKGICKIVCFTCDHVWMEDQMILKMVKETTFS